MYSSIAADTFSYIMTMDSFRNSMPEEHKPSWIKITTITMVSSFLKNVDIQKLRTFFENDRTVTIRMKDSTGPGVQWGIKETTFYNQITLTYVDSLSTKSVKLFPNGSIQVAGCSDLFDCSRVIRQLSFILKQLLAMDQTLPPDSFRVVMINSNFSLNYNINLFRITEIFSKYPMFNVSFDPDRYSAVKIKFRPIEEMKQVTTSIFSTGKIIVTGAETLREIVFAYNIINRVIYENKETVKVSKTPVQDVFDTMFGYNVPELIQYIHTLGVQPLQCTTKNFKINF